MSEQFSKNKADFVWTKWRLGFYLQSKNVRQEVVYSIQTNASVKSYGEGPDSDSFFKTKKAAQRSSSFSSSVSSPKSTNKY